MNISKFVDHTILKPDATKKEVMKICKQAIENDFYSVCVNGYYTSLCKKELHGTDIKIAVVVGFPLGQTFPAIKAAEAQLAVLEGASEIDMVMNIGALKDGDYDAVLEDIKGVVECGVPVKVILESPLLNDKEIEKATELSIEAGAAFVKTCTGFLGGVATVHDVSLMKKCANGKISVKASGGIRDIETAEQMIEAGANRIGASRLAK